MLATWGMTIPRPVKKHHTSTMGTANKEVTIMAGTTNLVHHSKVIQTLTPITPSLKDLVLGQARINKNLTKKSLNNDKMLENINSKLENLSSSVQN
jgi:hypothetical protein